MKVLFVIPGNEDGNSMIFAKRQVNFLASLGIQQEIFFLKSRTQIFELASDFFRFRKKIKSFEPDLIHCHYGTMTSFFAAFSNMKPLIITYHGSDLNFLKSENFLKEVFNKLLSQLSALRATAIICVSEKLKQKLWWRKRKTVVLPMGVDETFFTPSDYHQARKESGIADDEKIILFNDSGAPVKRRDIAEATATLVNKQIPTSRLVVLDGKITPEKIVSLLSACDCLLLCSDAEGSPTIVKEAMCCNLPVVSVDVGDVRQNIVQTSPHAITRQDSLQLAKGIEEILRLNKRSNGREVLIKLGLTEHLICSEIMNLYKRTIRK